MSWRVKPAMPETPDHELSPPSGEPILLTRGLGKRYGKRWAVNSLDLTVRRGEIYGFLGPNGAGKSTTIRMLLTLISPTTGSIELFGAPLRRGRRSVLSRVGGLVERADFYLYLSARRNLRIIGDLIGGVSKPQIDEALEIVGLAERAADKVKTYSHGMKQRLGLAGALLGSPELLILDEPTTGLDPQGIKEVRDLITHLAAEKKMTILLSSHLLAEIEQLASSMAIINNGTLVVQGNVQELLNSDDGVVVVDATPVAKAITVIGHQPGARDMKVAGNRVTVKLPADAVPVMNQDLVAAGVSVRSLVPRRSLEEYFLSLTEGEGRPR
jgi:ABC-type multidrug transport system ATPase subunit